ncbi:amidase [Vineibacter terrae]|uniref:Indoleacetamide hydrolase n=1 Tax=Vineibacter terrae TaxID=2586908 RepID=A0A5C8PNU5_9HYPH|nr:amidase [Vineibacter terrae]TXL75701.1 amidase [Vineibacter terrae]
MPVRLPSVEQLAGIARSFGLSLSGDDLASFRDLMRGPIASCARLDALVEPKLPVKYARAPGYRPSAEENPYNAWYWKTDIPGAASGLLAGKKVAIKDNICVAGVPMMNGSQLLEGYVPEIDATVVSRILDAGGTIAGKAACEDLCFSGASHTCATGPIRNPHNVKHSAGGSSGGSAAAVAAGDVPMALGGDQGGSIRTPSSWCGIYGLKPTWGLVPTTGSMPISYSVDHCGPMGASTEDVARLLAVIAGHDGHDPRTQLARTDDYMGALGQGIAGLRVGVLKQGFGHPESDPEVDRMVRAAIDSLAGAGATICEVSVPMHYDGPHIWSGIILEGAAEMMLKGYGVGNNVAAYYPLSMQEAFARGMASRINDASETVKLVLLLGEYLHRHYHNRYHSKAQNLRVLLRDAYAQALGDVDILAMPTIPFTATLIPDADCPRDTYVDRALNMQANTCPFDVSGNPAFTLPCGRKHGLPVGLMLVGRHFEESRLIAAAAAFEAIGRRGER